MEEYRGTDILHENMFILRKESDCRSDYDYFGVQHIDNYICTGGCKRRTRGGDSGGPLMVNHKGVWLKIGFASSQLYTRVTSYYMWIKGLTRGDVECVDLP